MATLGIFLIGVFVTVMVGAALALVLAGAVQDGQIQDEIDEERRTDDAPSRVGAGT